MSEIYVIRHAQASFGSDHYDKLSELGKMQAAFLGDYFNNIGIHFDTIYSGSLNRQIDTAKTVISKISPNKRGCHLNIREEFNEFDSSPGIISQIYRMIKDDPALSKDVSKIHSDGNIFQHILERAMAKWLENFCDDQIISLFNGFSKKVNIGLENLIKEIKSANDKVAIFTSGGTASVVLKLSLGLSNEDTFRLALQILNTSVSVFNYTNDRLIIKSFNSLAHLEILKNPGLLTYL